MDGQPGEQDQAGRSATGQVRVAKPPEALQSTSATPSLPAGSSSPLPVFKGPGQPFMLADLLRRHANGAVLRDAVEYERVRGLDFLLLPVALGLGAGIYYSLPWEPAWLPVAAACLILGLLVLRALFKGMRPNRAAVLVLAAMLGLLAGRLEAGKGTILLDGRVATTITGRVIEHQTDASGHMRYLLAVTATREPEVRRPPERVRLVARSSHAAHQPGTLISGRAQLTPPSGPAHPGGYDFARSAFGQGIGAYGFFYSAPVALAADTAWPGPVARLSVAVSTVRAGISERVRAAVPGDAGALIAALTVSDRGAISQATVDKLRATGLAHILAISGLHMALAAGTFFISLRKIAALSPRLIETRSIKKHAAVGAILIATAYLVISGAGIPTRRAWLMMVIMFGAVIFDRQALTMRNVALAAIAIILLTPSAVISPGFQMSFAATAALIAAYDGWSHRRSGRSAGKGLSAGPLGSVFRFAMGLAMTSLVAGVATGLFAAYHFHQFAAYGLLANLLAMPIVTFLVMPMGLAAMLAMPFGLDYWPLQAMGLGLEAVVGVAGYVDGLGGDLVTGQMPFGATLIAAAGFVALVFLRSRLRLLALVPLACGLVMALPPFRAAAPDILISEDGRLVGLVDASAIATNAQRPGDFIFNQWQRAHGKPGHSQPIRLEKARKTQLAADPHRLLGELAKMARGSPGRFVCADRSTCVAHWHGHQITAIADPRFLAAGCDLSEIVVLTAAIRTTSCRSGARLITGRQLKASGAMAIWFNAAFETGHDTDPPDARNAVAPTALRIVTALEGVMRPWTVQRYFSWRSDSFDFPGISGRRAVLATTDRARLANSPVEATRSAGD